jgi:hypothetical protein
VPYLLPSTCDPHTEVAARVCVDFLCCKLHTLQLKKWYHSLPHSPCGQTPWFKSAVLCFKVRPGCSTCASQGAPHLRPDQGKLFFHQVARRVYFFLQLQDREFVPCWRLPGCSGPPSPLLHRSLWCCLLLWLVSSQPAMERAGG